MEKKHDVVFLKSLVVSSIDNKEWNDSDDDVSDCDDDVYDDYNSEDCNSEDGIADSIGKGN